MVTYDIEFTETAAEVIAGAGFVDSDLLNGVTSPTQRAAFYAIESLILSHACAGVDVSTKAYAKGLQSAINTIERHQS